MLLRLPTELRLEIYECCSAYTLLNLSQSCTQLRNEIINTPSVFTESYGYFLPNNHWGWPNTNSTQLTINNIAYISGCDLRNEFGNDYSQFMVESRLGLDRILGDSEDSDDDKEGLTRWILCGIKGCYGSDVLALGDRELGLEWYTRCFRCWKEDRDDYYDDPGDSDDSD
ncbi:hypothetical protein BJ508DRAFT_114347 [Ascobolus immersus RN42]|uniref:F-box domain-containing protein n=1 Tax=Ascobolus immersus RN42 TaxID=1160509 RepID=A0A3N4I5L6_ASCIM|nr:hypothetical protein BJ508DRAFT_114347 [Ascobolus immersus RN42]